MNEPHFPVFVVAPDADLTIKHNIPSDRDEPEIKGGLKFLKDKGLKITHYEESSEHLCYIHYKGGSALILIYHIQC
jgi:hypothetical protein